MASIQGIYIALFGRPADPAGLAFFNTATKNGADLGAIGNLAGTAEYQTRFSGQTNDQIVNSIYQSLFGRSGEASGVSFWVSQLTSGRFNINNIAIAILDGAQGSDLATINAKIAAANIFTTHLDLPAEINAYVGNTAASIGRDYVSSITTTNAGTDANADAAILRLQSTTGGQNPANGGDLGGGGGGGPVNAPATFSGDDKGTVKEDGININVELKSAALTEKEVGLLTASGKLDVADTDANQSGVQAAIVKGVYGSLEINNAGTWTYTLNNEAKNVQELKEGESVTDTITVRSTDGTPHTITITVEGTNDTPIFSGESTGSVKEDAEVLTATGTLVATDADKGENSFQAASDLKGEFGSLSIGADGKWTYTLDNTNTKVQALGENYEPLTDTVKVQSFDGTETSITVTINGTNDAPIFAGTDTGTVKEDGMWPNLPRAAVAAKVDNDTGLLTASGTLEVADTDAGQSGTQEATVKGVYGSLTIDTAGNWTYTLDNNATNVQELKAADAVTDAITVNSTDGTPHTITITVNGTDDAATFTGDMTGSVKEDAEVLTATGTLIATDADKGDTGFQASDVAGTYGKLSIGTDGKWTYTLDNTKTDVQALADKATLTDTVTVKSFDGTTQDITITINGTNDVAKIDGTVTGSVMEDANELTATGTLTVSDVDAGQDSFQATGDTSIAGTYGSLSIDDKGNWTYTIDNSKVAVQELAKGVTVDDVIEVKSFDGTTQKITVTVTGTNDAATFSGDITGSVKEEDSLTATGTLVATDVDKGEVGFKAASDVAGTYGKLSIDADGKWIYTLDNANKDVQALAEKATLTDTVKVQSFDGTSQDITVTINGTNDNASITGTNSGDVAEDGTATTGAKLSVSDVDTGENGVNVPANLNGTYGAFKLAADGTWSYDLANDSEAVQGLTGGEKVTDTLTVKSVDGTATETLTVNITGKNDAATFSGESTGSAKEDTTLTATGTLKVADVDKGEASFQAATDVAGTYGKLSIATDGKWTYSLDNNNTKVQALGDNKTLTDTVTVKSFDGTTQDITVTINGTNDTASITGTKSGDVAEDGTTAASGKLGVSDVDTGENGVAIPADLNGTYGTFKLATDGTWSYDLANSSDAVQGLKGGEKVTDTLTVKSVDGSATETLTVNITGKNDAATFTGKDTGAVTEDAAPNTATGTLNVADVDKGEASFKAATDVAGTYGKLAIAADGKWTYALDNTKTVVQALAAGATAVDKIKVASFDGTEHTIEVTVTGVNDVAVIGGTKTGAVTEDNATTTATGTLTVTDVDTNEASFTAQTATKGTYGSLTVGTDGKWTYTLDNSLAAVNALKGGETKQDTFNVTSKDGLTPDQVKITVTGANDAPTITLTSGSAAVTVAENNAATEIAKVVVADVDGTAQTPTLSGTDASKFSFANGTLTLNAGVDYEALPANDKILNVTLTTTDSSNANIKTTQDFAVTISNGSDTYALSSGGTVQTIANFDESGPVIDKLSVVKATMSVNPTLGTLGSGAYQEINNTNNASSFAIQNNKGVIEFKGAALAFNGEKLIDDVGQNATRLFDALRKDSQNPFDFSLDHIDTQNGWKGYVVAYQDGDAFVYYGNSSANSFGWDTELKANEVKLVGIVKGVAEGSLDFSHFTVV